MAEIKILENVEKYKINEIILAMPSAKKKEIQAILGICKNTDADLKILPGVYQLVNGGCQRSEASQCGD